MALLYVLVIYTVEGLLVFGGTQLYFYDRWRDSSHMF
jgi:hypothetical protein